LRPLDPTVKVDFSKFGIRFQENLAKLITLDRTFADQIGEVLDTNFFEVKYLQAFTKMIYDYKEKYKVHPSLVTLATLVRSMEGENEVVEKQVRDFLVRIHSTRDVEGKDFIKDAALDFCRKQKLKEAIIKSVDLLNNSSFDEISEIINKALILGQNNDFGYDYIRDFERRFEVKTRDPVSTGWKQFDEIMRDGLGKGELGVVISPTGTGKSHILVHLGAQALKQGKTVVHYTFELADTMIARRYDACLTGTPLSDLNTFKDQILEDIKEIDGQLIVKEYPTKSATTVALRSHLEKLVNRDIDIGMIIVDYADLIKPKKLYNEKRHSLESIYEELRGIAQEFKCPIWTASQTNRTGYNAEIVTMESISEAFNKCFVADFIFTLSRTVEDKNANSGRFFVAKNRFGPDGLVYPIDMDAGKVKVKIANGAAGKNGNPAKTQEQILKEKYRELMGNNNGTSK
jgi:hypothetical protein